jgi:hypothetical protein
MELIWIAGVIGIAAAGFCAFIASQKNRAAFPWFMLGLFFSLFALIAIAAAPAKEKVNVPADSEPIPIRPSTRFERMIGPVLFAIALIVVILYSLFFRHK